MTALSLLVALLHGPVFPSGPDLPLEKRLVIRTEGEWSVLVDRQTGVTCYGRREQMQCFRDGG